MTLAALRVDDQGERLCRGDSAVFLLTDTLWAAFSRMTDAEWARVVRLRRQQGFTGVNVSILPIRHDRSIGSDDRLPFHVDTYGSWDFDRPDLSYFARARSMIQAATAAGLSPVLVVLWSQYAAGVQPGYEFPGPQMSAEQIERYTALVLETFADLHPVLAICGDETLGPDTDPSIYAAILRQIKAHDPRLLTTAHTTPGTRPAQHPGLYAGLDLHTFQSGHDRDFVRLASELPPLYTTLRPRRPVISIEPCYEAHQAAAAGDRHDARAVRHASWTAVLSGAGAGLGYGAHGAWSWHRKGDEFTGTAFSGTPLSALEAIGLPGATDVVLLRRLVESRDLYRLSPRQDLVASDSDAIVGLDPETGVAAVYVPSPGIVELDGDLRDFSVEVWDLAAARRVDDHGGGARRWSGSRGFLDSSAVTADALYVLRPA